MNGPQRTCVFRKEFTTYSLFGYKRNLLPTCVRQDMDEWKDERMDGQTDNVQFLVSPGSKRAFAKQ